MEGKVERVKLVDHLDGVIHCTPLPPFACPR